MKHITSVHNPIVKQVLLLQEKSKERKKTNTFVIEGKREIDLAVKGGYKLEKIFIFEELISAEIYNNWNNLDTEIISVSKDVYQKIAYRDSTEGVFATAKMKNHNLDELSLPKNCLILVLENIEKPGNIGAILRTADAAKVDAVFIANTNGAIYNPNCIRSSVGCVFTNTIIEGTSEVLFEFLIKNNIDIKSATLQNANEYHKHDFTKSCAIVVGSEAHGLSQIWRNPPAETIYIPMLGEIDSMNVSVATAIITFEAKRQRNFK